MWSHNQTPNRQLNLYVLSCDWFINENKFYEIIFQASFNQ